MADGLSALCQQPAFSSLLPLPSPPSSSSLSLNVLLSSCQALSISSPNYISNPSTPLPFHCHHSKQVIAIHHL